jgi:hypothetical protein
LTFEHRSSLPNYSSATKYSSSLLCSGKELNHLRQKDITSKLMVEKNCQSAEPSELTAYGYHSVKKNKKETYATYCEVACIKGSHHNSSVGFLRLQ